jgi:ribosomal protein S19E (S16A)
MRNKDTNEIIEKLAEELKSTVVAPEWASYVKTSHGKEKPPVRSDWWQVRAASIMLKVEKLGPVGVSKLSVKYGNNKNRGVRPEKFARGARNHLRKILQQLEDKKLIEQRESGTHKGRVLTTQGKRLIIKASK